VGGQPKVTWVRRKGTAAEALDGTVYAYAAFHHAKKKYNQKTMWQQLAEAIGGSAKPAPEKSPVAFNLLEGQRVF
jgi:phage terminase large subunit GpA-like protein